MKKVKVIVKGKSLLELQEDAHAGDLIDLADIVEVDTSYIESIIENGRDNVYNSKLESEKQIFEANKRAEIQELNSQIDSLKKQQEDSIALEKARIEKEYDEKIHKLELELFEAKNVNDKFLIQKENELESKYKDRISELEQKLQISEELKNKDIEQAVSQKEYELEKVIGDLKLENVNNLSDQKNKYDAEIADLNDKIYNLQRAKSMMNVKQTGEDLEGWCDNEVTSYMQNGLFNCTWTKDNKVVKEEGENKGSKADYIFRVYSDENHDENELLTSVCLDMKDENPDSTNKKTNADYYKALDNNRNKKDCKYAVLVSNLELDKPNDIPIYKVIGYEDMYVVRPAYMMVFLNMIASLTKRFQTLILTKKQEKIDLLDKINLIDKFNDIKKTYLDNPLATLEKHINVIQGQSDSIKKAASKIDEEVDNVKRLYINQINDKISRFELGLKSITKKLD